MAIKKRNKSAGFTLIEILVVIFIISIVTGVALLSMGRNENKKLEAFANEIIQTLTLAEEQAMLKPLVLGLSISDHQLRFHSYQFDPAEKKQAWTPFADRYLAPKTIPTDIQVGIVVGDSRVMDVDHAELREIPQIIISTNGDITPFTLYIGMHGKQPRYVIKGDADGNIAKFDAHE